MLQQLCIENFAIVRTLAIEFGVGFTAITGETGAGKSIMVDALGLVLGDRADTGIIRDGSDRAEISALFDITGNRPVAAWLEGQQLEADSCILRRVISKDGRSRAYINGTPSTLGQLRKLGEALTDIHSQHEHQSLLKTSTHRILLDEFAGCSSLAKQVSESCHHWASLNEQLSELATTQQNRDSEMELAAYQLEELDALQLQDNELEALERDQVRMANAQSTLQLGHQALKLCLDIGADDQQTNSLTLLTQALRFCEQIKDTHPLLVESTDLLNNARIQIEEAARSLQGYLETVHIDPQQLQIIEQRLADILQLARKHRVTPAQLVKIRSQLVKKLQHIEQSDLNLEELMGRIAEELIKYRGLTSKLTEARLAAVDNFSTLVEKQLASLGMNSTRFVINTPPVTTGIPSTFGMESIEFLISPNPGQQPRALQKIASGGELSRISLAIQVISAQTSTIPTLIFDEVDVGIGGATAEVVGRLLSKLGGSGQVICVTHQPQVAARADNHLIASKSSNPNTTDSKIAVLSKEARIREIARMLGGIDISERTLAHAEEMLHPSVDIANTVTI